MKWYSRIFCALLLSGATLATAENLVVNPDFDKLDAKGFPAGWQQIATGGAQSARIAGQDGAAVSTMHFALAGAGQTRIEQRMCLTPEREYQVEFDAKSENLSSAGVYLTTMKWSGGASQLLKGTAPWRHYSFKTKFTGTDTYYRLILYAPKGATGKLWLRNLQVTEILPTATLAAPVIPVAMQPQAPVIDGKLDEALWRQTAAVAPFVKCGKFQYTQFAADPTEAMLSSDGSCLYVGFRCFQQCLDPVRNTLNNFKNTRTQADDDLFKDDCVIVLVQAGSGADAPVYEFTVNAAGTLTDAVCRGGDLWVGRNVGFSGRARAAGHVGDGFYSVELAVPLSELGLKARNGETFKILLGRINHDQKEGTLYFPSPVAFHVRAALGDAEFCDVLPGISSFRPGLSVVGVKKLSVALEQPTALEIVAVGENRKPLTLKKTLAAGTDTVSYPLPGQEYNTVGYSFARRERTLWRTPAYVIGNAIKTVEAGSRKYSVESGLYPWRFPAGAFTLGSAECPVRFSFPQAPELVAVDQTRFWPEDDNNIHIAENSIQPLHVVAVTPQDRLGGLAYRWHLILPDELQLVAATATKVSPYRLSCAPPQKLQVGDRQYDHYSFTLNIPQVVKAAPDAADLFTFLVALPTSGRPFPRAPEKAWYFAEWGDGKVIEAPGELKLNFYPPLQHKVPKKFRTEMWGGRMVNLADTEANRQFLQRSVQGSGFNQLQNFPIARMKRMGVLSLKNLSRGAVAEYIRTHPETRRIDVRNRPVDDGQYNFCCPSAMIENPEIYAGMLANMRKGYANDDVINFDYESPALDGNLSCYCPRCLARFTAFAKLGRTPDGAAIAGTLSEAWIDFMTSQVAECAQVFRRMAGSFGKELSFYSGYQSPKTRNYYTVDWCRLAGKIDVGSAGYWPSATTVAATVAALNGTPLLCGVITEPWHVNSRQKSMQVPLAELFVGLVAGGKGGLCYNLPGVDGRSYWNFSQYHALLSDHEALLYDGKRTQEGVTVTGVPTDAWTVFRLGDAEMLVVYNRQRTAVNLKIEFTHAAGRREYYTGKTFSGSTVELELPGYGAAALWKANGKNTR